MLGGVNHIFYHGCCYSPDDVAWPGWLFYASTEMNPRNAILRDIGTLNAYVGRCQAILQSGKPDNDILLYWPIHDLWHTAPGIAQHQEIGAPPAWLAKQPIGATASFLWDHGFEFDYVSDRQLAGIAVRGGHLIAPGAEYSVIVVPPVAHMPVETLLRLKVARRTGSHGLSRSALPTDVPGLEKLADRQKLLHDIESSIVLSAPENGVRHAVIGKGQFLVGDLEVGLRMAKVNRETLVEKTHASLIRRRFDVSGGATAQEPREQAPPALGDKNPEFSVNSAGRHYFIANETPDPIDGWFELGVAAKTIIVMDPMTGQTGLAEMRKGDGHQEFHLCLEPNHSIILRTLNITQAAGPAYHFAKPRAEAGRPTGPWDVQFIDGGPTLPEALHADKLASWTINGDPETERFAGTAHYQITFPARAGPGPWVLDLARRPHRPSQSERPQPRHADPATLSRRVVGRRVEARWQYP